MNIFPDIIGNVPRRDYGIDGLKVHVDHTSTGTVYFVSAEKEVRFPEHSHAAQWTVVVSGECRFTADGRTTVYKQGDTYFIPAGLKHQITLCPGYAEVDYVDDPKDGETQGFSSANRNSGDNMERRITVNGEKCTHCGLCVADCPMCCLELGDENTPQYRDGAVELCIACQHCMAVCPAGALAFGGLNPADSLPTAYGDSDALLRLIQSRRSMRHFKDEDIPTETLAKIQAMLPFTPTASNADSLHFSIVTSRERMAAIRRATYAKTPLFGEIDSPGLRRYRERIADGEDIIYRGAPVMIAVAAEKERTTPPFHGIVDAAISLTLVDLYAQSLGLGVVWCGLALHAALQLPEVLALLEIPEEYALCYTMLLGIPAVKYPRTVQPEPFSMKML